MQLRYGLIGAGMMGLEHLRYIEMLQPGGVVAVADPYLGSLESTRSELARLRGGAPVDTAFYDSHQDMLADADLDAVVIVTPNFTHIEQLRDVMQRPLHVMVEKPLCTTVEDCREAIALDQGRTHLTWVGLEYRYMPPVTELVKHAHAGVAGPARMLSIREHRFPFLMKVDNWNRFTRNTGGTLVEKCCHFFDLMRHILRDEPERVFATGGQAVNHLHERYDDEAPDILDHAYVVVEFRGGARALLDLCMFGEGARDQEAISIVGDIGKLSVKIPEGVVRYEPRNRIGGVEEHVGVDADVLAAGSHHGATYFEHLRFRLAIENGAPADVTLHDGLMATAMGVAAHRSIAEGRPIAMEEVLAAPAGAAARQGAG